MIKNRFFMAGFLMCHCLTFSSVWAQTSTDDIMSIFSEYETPRISMDFKNAALSDVLKIFSQQSGRNFIVSTDISSKSVNLYLDNVPVDEALERLLTAHDLTYDLQSGSNIFIVKDASFQEPELVTRVYPLQHATIPSSKLNSTFSMSDDSEGEDDTTSLATGVRYALESLLSDQGRIIEDPRTNSLVITDYLNRFPLIEQALARLDVRVEQILIEVEMLDISKNSAEQLGAKFGDTPYTFKGAEKDGLWPFNIDNVADDNIVNHIPGALTALFEEPRYRVSTMSFAGFQFVVNFLRTHSDTKNLARPRILTLNNETAQIQIETDEAIGEISISTSTEGIGESSQEAERVETGVYLTVTPQANSVTNEILMAIEPRVVQAKTSQGFVGADKYKDPEKRETKSILRVKNGDTIILGGLLRTDSDDVRTKLPIISKIPILGAAFRHKEKSVSERELIIFITPHIVEEDDSFSDMQHASRQTSQMMPIVREQDVPYQRQQSIKDELSFFENLTTP